MPNVCQTGLAFLPYVFSNSVKLRSLCASASVPVCTDISLLFSYLAARIEMQYNCYVIALILLIGSWKNCGPRELSVSIALSLIMTLWVFFVVIGGGFDCLRINAYDGFGRKMELSV